MRSATLYRYSVPMDAGVVLRNQRLKTRDGLLVRLRQGERQGWGEIAPLPGFSEETLAQAEQAALAWLPHWQAGDDPVDSPLPSVAFGLSCARAELEQRLPPQADYRKAPLCTGDPDALFEALATLPGEKVAKVKVGLYEAVRDGMIVNVLLEALPELRLRLDANRSWSRARADASPSTLIRRCAIASPISKNPAGPARNRAHLPEIPASPSPGTKACASPTSWCGPSRAWRRSSSSRC